MHHKTLEIPNHLLWDGHLPTSAPNLGTMEVIPAAAPVLSDWQRARLGKITGSCFHRITYGRGGKGWSQTAESYLYELVFETLTGQPASRFNGNAATDWGNEHEPIALERYCKTAKEKVERGVFYAAKGFQIVGATPDGLTTNKVIEIKCPYTPKNHIRTLITGEIPDEYQDQVYGEMLCTGREWCDFISYDPRMPDQYKMCIVHVEAQPHILQELRDRIGHFETYVLDTLRAFE